MQLVATVHRLGSSVQLAPIPPPHKSSGSSASPVNVQKGSGLASPSSCSLCPWRSQIQGTPLPCELAPQETPQHPKALQDMGFS